MLSRPPEPVSPELILVAPPEEAELARKRLGEGRSEESVVAKGRLARTSHEAELAPQPGADSGVSDWGEFLTSVRSSATAAAEIERSRARSPQVRRRSRNPIVLAVAILVVAGSIGLAWARARSEQRANSPPLSTGVGSEHAPTLVKPTRRLKASKQARSSRVRPATNATASQGPAAPPGKHSKPALQSKPAAGSGAFVPSRIWSWVAQPGARRYLVRFFHNGRTVLAVRTSRPRLVLSRRFAFHQGRYRWTVVSIPAKGTSRRPIVDSTFVVSSSEEGAR